MKRRRSRRKPDETTLADRVSEALTLAGASQKQFNRDARLGKGHMSRILSGERKRLRDGTMRKMISAFTSYGVAVTEDYIRYGHGVGPSRLGVAS